MIGQNFFGLSGIDQNTFSSEGDGLELLLGWWELVIIPLGAGKIDHNFIENGQDWS